MEKITDQITNKSELKIQFLNLIHSIYKYIDAQPNKYESLRINSTLFDSEIEIQIRPKNEKRK